MLVKANKLRKWFQKPGIHRGAVPSIASQSFYKGAVPFEPPGL